MAPLVAEPAADPPSSPWFACPPAVTAAAGIMADCGISSEASRASTANPVARAPTATVSRKITTDRRPSTRHRVVRVAPLVAGPVMRKTSAAPGDNPAWISDSAMGVEAVAQT